MKEQEVLRIVIAGHVDHGKSTLIGRLLYESGSLPKEKLQEIKQASKELGKEAELAFLTDQLREEREESKTIDTTQIFFRTKKRNYCIIDAPGHTEFVKNMITGASQADAAVLILDVHEGLQEQTRRHATILSLLQLHHPVVVLNKMDLVQYNPERFEKRKREILSHLSRLGLTPREVIPISAKEGTNIHRSTQLMPWYKGPALLSSLDQLPAKHADLRAPFRFVVQDLYDLDGEKIALGKVVAGTARPGENTLILPSRKTAHLRHLRVFGSVKRRALPGECLGLTLTPETQVQRGDLLVCPQNPPSLRTTLQTHLLWLSSNPVQVGQTLKLRCATQETDCVVKAIHMKIDTSTLALIEESASALDCNEMGRVTLKTTQPIVMEPLDQTEELGRFIVEQSGELAGAGVEDYSFLQGGQPL